jgi:son of sevenless-like protein
MSGLLERVCRNFNFVDPMEILTSTLDERGYPQIGGGTVQQLVQRLTHHQFIDQEFTAAFFLTYRLFTTPIEFLRLLVARFKIAPPPAAPSSSAALGMDNDPASFQTSVRKPVQQRVIQTILLWLTSPLTGQDWEIKDAPHALELAKFIDEDVMKEEEHKLHATAIQSILVKGRTVTTLRGGLKLGAGGPTPTPATAAPGSITSIADFDPSVVAATIAVEDASLFRDVQFKEFLHKSWSDPKFEEIAPGLFKMTQRFNQLGQWVAYEIVRPELPKERAHVIQAFVSIAQELLELRDYSGMLAIMGGLNNSSVSRLKKTAQKLSSKTTQQLEHLNESVSGKDNYRFLRQKWTDAEPPAVPFLAMALKDLTFIEDGNPDSLENGGINFYKWRKLSEVVHNIMQYRDIPYSVQPSDDVTNYLSKGIVEAKELAEDGIFKTSKKRE